MSLRAGPGAESVAGIELGAVVVAGSGLGAVVVAGTGLGALVVAGSGVLVKDGAWINALVGVLVFIGAVGCGVIEKAGKISDMYGTYNILPAIINSEFPRQFVLCSRAMLTPNDRLSLKRVSSGLTRYLTQPKGGPQGRLMALGRGVRVLVTVGLGAGGR